MCKKFGICCVNCQQPLNNEDKIFGTSCGHLYHSHCICSNHGKSAICMHCTAYKPMIFEMHLTFDDSPLAGKLQEKNIEIINKLNDYERNDTLLKSSYNAARYSIQQLESKVKTLKDGIQAKDAVVNELQDRIEVLEALNQHLSNKNCNNAAEVSSYYTTNENNSTKNDNNNDKKKKYQQQPPNHVTTNNKGSFNNINKGNWYNKNPYNATKLELVLQTTNGCNDENYNEDDVASSANSRQHTTLLSPEEKQEILDDILQPSNSVVIKNFKSDDTSLDSAIINVIRLGQRMGLKITSHEINDIYIFNRNPPFLTYLVEFRNKNFKTKFLEKSHILENFRKTKFLTIS